MGGAIPRQEESFWTTVVCAHMGLVPLELPLQPDKSNMREDLGEVWDPRYHSLVKALAFQKDRLSGGKVRRSYGLNEAGLLTDLGKAVSRGDVWSILDYMGRGVNPTRKLSGKSLFDSAKINDEKMFLLLAQLGTASEITFPVILSVTKRAVEAYPGLNRKEYPAFWSVVHVFLASEKIDLPNGSEKRLRELVANLPPLWRKRFEQLFSIVHRRRTRVVGTTVSTRFGVFEGGRYSGASRCSCLGTPSFMPRTAGDARTIHLATTPSASREP